MDIEGTFDSVCQLFQEAANEQERNRLLQLASTLSAHNLDVWQQAGPYVQHVLIGKLQHLDAEKLEMLRPVAINIIQEILDTTVTGTSSTYDAITFRTGAVTPSDQLTNIRKEALSIAKKLYNAARSQQDKRNVIGVFSEAARLPHMGQYPDALVREVLSDAADIVEFYTEIAPSEDFEILQAIEHDLLWWYRWRRGITDKVVSDPTVFEQRDRLLEKIQRFRSVIDGNEQFIKFKTLVGYESVFPPAWDDDEFEVKGEDAYRTKCIEAYVEQITNANADDWFRFIQRCAKTVSNDLATFHFFGEFLDRVGAHRDEVAFTYLDKIDDEFAWILPSLLNGIAKSDRKPDVEKKITEWIESGKFLRQIAQHFRWTSSLDVGLLRRLQDKAISRSDEETVLACLEAVLGRQEEAIDELEETIIHPAFRFLTTHQNVNWINLGWYLAKAKSVLVSASSETIDIVLKNLIYVQRINHRSERILATLANKLPEKVIDFFADRIRFKEGKDVSEKYEAVPYEFHDLKDKLSKAEDHLLKVVRQLYVVDSYLFRSRAIRLLTIVFPSFPESLQHKLHTYIRPDEHSDLEFVVHVLDSYQGQSFLYEMSKDLIDALPSNDKLLSMIRGSLLSTGLVSGEFGLVQAYTKKKMDLKHWLSDPRKKVRSFAEDMLRQLKNYITSEQQRAEEELEMRKLEWGIGEEDGDQDREGDDSNDKG